MATIRVLLLCSAVVLGAASPAVADTRSDAEDQVQFGIAVAQKGLWQEALYRWERATEMDPSYAAAWNNLGVAFEHHGRFDEARERTRKHSILIQRT